MRPALLLALAPALALALAGVGGCGPEPRDLSFFFEYEPGGAPTGEISPDSGAYDLTIPILLSSHTSRPTAGFAETRVLYPLVLLRREGRETERRILFPFVWERRRIDHQGFLDYDLLAPPLVYGHSVDEGGYFMIFPFGGNAKGYLGKDEIRTVLFPVYLWSRDKGYQSTYVLWPIVNWVSGDGHTGWKLWPFYGHYERVDPDGRLTYERSFAMWPLVTWQRNNLNSAHPVSTFFVFPFYGRIRSDHINQWTVLWPFFRKFENSGTYAGGPYSELRAPFPFVILSEGRDRVRRDFWPFFGWKRRVQEVGEAEVGYDRFYRHFIVWPIHRYERHETNAFDDRKLFFAPIFWSYRRDWKGPRGELDAIEREREVKVWPLLKYERSRTGDVEVTLLSPLWFRDPAGFERIWNPLFRLYRYAYDAESGLWKRDFLWGIVNTRRKAAADESTVNVLFGLFKYNRHANGEKGLRFFFLPEWPTWGGPDEDEATAESGRGPVGHGIGRERAPSPRPSPGGRGSQGEPSPRPSPGGRGGRGGATAWA